MLPGGHAGNGKEVISGVGWQLFRTLSQMYVHWDAFRISISSSTYSLLSDVTVLLPAIQ